MAQPKYSRDKTYQPRFIIYSKPGVAVPNDARFLNTMHIANFISKYKHDQLSIQHRELLFDWMQLSPENELLFMDLTNEYYTLDACKKHQMKDCVDLYAAVIKDRSDLTIVRDIKKPGC